VSGRLPLTREDVRQWLAYLREMGVSEMGSPPTRRQRVPQQPEALFGAPPAPGAASTDSGFDVHDPRAGLAEARGLEAVRTVLGNCGRCKLYEGRTNIVFGTGNPRARLMFVGEGPGADEDAQGIPFVGRAGQKLTEMIEKGIGVPRSEVYIANIVKCRPPQNRDPQPDEIAACSPFLWAQIAAVAPEVLVTLGAPATRTLLGTSTGITRLRGQWHEFRGVPVMPTFHPAYLLRAYTPANRRMVYEDLLAVRARLGLQP
jgi:DNA polymerase